MPRGRSRKDAILSLVKPCDLSKEIIPERIQADIETAFEGISPLIIRSIVNQILWRISKENLYDIVHVLENYRSIKDPEDLIG